MTAGLSGRALREYASRICEHFPEVFLKLGSPHLTSEFDLQAARGAKVYLTETPNCMLIELRLPRLMPQMAGRIGSKGSSGSSDARPGTPAGKTSLDGLGDTSPFPESLGDMSPFSKSIGNGSTIKSDHKSGEEHLHSCSSCHKLVGARSHTLGSGIDAAGALAVPGTLESHGAPPAPCARMFLSAGHSSGPATRTTLEYEPGFVRAASDGVLSAAALARLPSRQHFLCWEKFMDPGKPMLSSPGSHDPWSSVSNIASGQ